MKSPMQPTRTMRTQADLLRRRCSSALAKHRQRAKSAGVGQLPYTAADLMTLVAAAKTCCYCGTPLGFGTLAFDHATPTGRPGGRHTLDNLVCCCQRCNLLKGLLTTEEFAALRAFLATLHPAGAEDLARRLIAGGVRYARR